MICGCVGTKNDSEDGISSRRLPVNGKEISYLLACFSITVITFKMTRKQLLREET